VRRNIVGRAGGHDLNSAREGGVRKRRAGVEDVEIGRKIRALRLERGLSQSGLADGIGLTFQQVQKYEKGTNRVSAGRLQRIAEVLEMPVMFFYSGMGARGKKHDTRGSGLAFLQTKGAMRLMRAYSEIPSRTTKYALVMLAEALRNREKA
jgi:DNA-binding XRE family transcriptional regulator